MIYSLGLLVVASLHLCVYVCVLHTVNAQATQATWNRPTGWTEGNTLCFGQETLDASKQLALRFRKTAVLAEDDFRRLLQEMCQGLQTAGCQGDPSAQLTVDGQQMNCSECLSLKAIYSANSGQEGLPYRQLTTALQDVALSLTNVNCRQLSAGQHRGHKPSIAQTWGYGLGFVTLVCIISNIGGLLTPVMSKTYFQRLLQFLVAMGAGTLAATGLLVLIPEAFDIVSIEEIGNDYIWKATTALFTIYVFFISERFLKFFLKSREVKAGVKRNQSLCVSPPADTENNLDNGQSELGHSHFLSPTPTYGQKRGPVATVAWMVLIGDVIHNFVDGMAIGAAFTENVYLGVSIGIAVLCEELPHELGDVAILLHSGMSMKRALLLNFLSACVCYLGLVLGIVLGENTEANRWILAIAGGLFLYVPLVDMLPDMSQYLDLKLKQSQASGETMSTEVWVIFIFQSIGLFFGICIILIVINCSGMIEINQ